MKKIFLLIFILIGITGCYDYQELNNLAIISGIAIDYQDEKYIVNFEVLNNKKNDSKQESPLKSYLVEAEAPTISEAFLKTSDKISKECYFAHLKIFIMSETAAKEKLLDITDYIIREPTIRNIFYPVIATNTSAKDILNSNTTEDPITSQKIENIIKTNKYGENISIATDFEKFVDLFEDPRIDPYITAIAKIDDKLELTGLAAFQDKKLKAILKPEDAAIFNVIKNKALDHLLKLPCKEKDGYTIINLYQNKNTKLEIDEKTLKIKSNLKASITKDSCGYNFRDDSIYNELEKKFNEILKEQYIKFWKNIKEEQTDILGIQKQYYQKKRTELSNWYNLKLETDIKIDLNKNGMTFEVKNK